MIFIVTALYIEAKPFIEFYDLKRDNDDRYFQIFERDNIILIITGTGKINSAVGVSHILTSRGVNVNDYIFNVGLCGSKHENENLGTIYLINKVIDNETKREFYPDILLRHHFEESDIETFSTLVKDNQNIKARLCDMETSGFYCAATKYFSPHQIHIIKVVSDKLEGKSITKQFVENIIKQNVEAVDDYIKSVNISLTNKAEKEVLTRTEKDMIEKVVQQLRFTHSQKCKCLKLCKKYKIRTHKNLEILKTFNDIKVDTKDERNKIFTQICRQLLK